MTAQIPDTVSFTELNWTLAGSNGFGMWQPRAHQLDVTSAGSACWRGYVCRYALTEVQFTLVRVDLRLRHSGPPRSLLGRPPTRPSGRMRVFGFTAEYDGLSVPVEFTGTILLARGVIRELAVNMGFEPAWKYRQVVEVRLDAGQVLAITDRSDEIAAVRDKLKAGPLRPDSPASADERKSWVEQAFWRGYEDPRTFLRLVLEGAPKPHELVWRKRNSEDAAAEDQDRLRGDRAFLELLGEERSSEPCRARGCLRGSVVDSVLCAAHHFESVFGRAPDHGALKPGAA